MNKRLIVCILTTFLLTACGSNSSWENDKVTESHRIQEDSVKAEWTLDNKQASLPNGGTQIRLQINKMDGSPVEKFDINHEKLLHLIVISKDLSYFNHIHPEYKGHGLFEVVNSFPAGGDYLLIADFQPSGGDAMTKMKWVQVDGKRTQPVPVIPDSTLDKTVDGKRVMLSIDQMAANQPLTLKFSIRDQKNNHPITDLQPYLGSIGHVVILSEDGKQYLHVHADEGQGTGPDATFETEFPKSGIYKIWAQFQRENQVFTVAYVVRVP
jgi:hypothetical protein